VAVGAAAAVAVGWADGDAVTTTVDVATGSAEADGGALTAGPLSEPAGVDCGVDPQATARRQIATTRPKPRLDADEPMSAICIS